MQSKKPCSAAKAVLRISLALMLASTLVPTQTHAQTFKVLHSFTGGGDGAYPYAGLVQDAVGNLYGAAADGGDDPSCSSYYTYGCGVIFVLDRNGEERVIRRLNGANGALPLGTPTLDRSGNLYGTTNGGGFFGSGTVFIVSKAQKERFFSLLPGSEYADAGVVRDREGNLYGTTTAGGAGDGTVYKLSVSRECALDTFSASGECVLHIFTGERDGSNPEWQLLIDADGNLYGTTVYGGPFRDSGTVFEITRSGKFVLLYAFTGGADGGGPDGPLMQDAQGNLYGTTGGGGTFGAGTVFKLDRNGKETVIHSFNYTDGISPVGNLAMDAGRNIYGTTVGGGVGFPAAGTVFKLDAAGQETVLHNFDEGPDGGTPYTGVTRDDSGNLYGTTSIGGSGNCSDGEYFGCGVVFEITP